MRTPGQASELLDIMFSIRSFYPKDLRAALEKTHADKIKGETLDETESNIRAILESYTKAFKELPAKWKLPKALALMALNHAFLYLSEDENADSYEWAIRFADASVLLGKVGRLL